MTVRYAEWKRMFLLACLIAPAVELRCTDVDTEQPTSRPTQISTLISNFRSSDWEKVFRAEWQLESLQSGSIPVLLSLLDADDTVELINTADLIYPGARTFDGHGWIIDYDLDYVPARAGWAIEELTFEDFGFSEGRIREQDLLQIAIAGISDVPLVHVLPSRPDLATRRARIRDAIDLAKAWWAKNAAKWTRYRGLRDALESNDPARQVRALGWIQYGTSKCDGLDPSSYRRDLLPRVEALTRSADEAVRIQAGHLVNDDEQWWWKYKTDPALRDWVDPSAESDQ